ncbi:MAG: Gfo/Idh/MocA family oxidoreductase [Anaerolineae bacterium]|nr:Gfo/Idh/MocA family oxidoreductase [Anaerolineae bacterium]
MATYRVGLVGAQRGASLVTQFEVHPDTEITALCDLNETRLAGASEDFKVPDSGLFTSYDEFLDAPIDVVVVGTPIQLHAEQAIKAMESGKHVLSEVTAAWTIEQCAQIVDAVRQTGQTYMLAENMCYVHYVRQWREWISQGRIGEIFYAEAEYIHDIRHLLWDDSSGEALWRLERPPIYYCSHSLGPLLMLMEDRVVRTTCAHAGYSTVPNRGPSCLNMEVALFETQKGALIKLLRSQVAPREPGMHYYSLYGTKGFVENDHGNGWYGGKGKLFVEGEMDEFEVIDCPNADPAATQDQLRGGHGSCEYFLVQDFVRALQTNSRPPIDVIRGMDFTVPGICAHESAMNRGEWIDVPLFEW